MPPSPTLRSLAHLERAIRQDPRDSAPWLELGRLCARNALHPEFLDRHLHLGPLLTHLGQLPEARPLIPLALEMLGLEEAPTPGESPDAALPPPPCGLPREVIRGKDRAPMLLLPGGKLTTRRLSNEVLGEEPQLRAIPPHYMDRWEVTVEAFGSFLREQDRPPPRYWKRQLVHPRSPVVFVSFQDVLAYADWVGARPAREAEWEAACRGPRPSRFPWGDAEASPAHANFHADAGPLDPRLWDQHLRAVEASPLGRSPGGVEDLLGNVQEWCLTDDAAYPPPDQTPSGALREAPASQSPLAVIRGASWHHREGQLHALARQVVEPRTREATLGFRLVIPLPVQDPGDDHGLE